MNPVNALNTNLLTELDTGLDSRHSKTLQEHTRLNTVLEKESDLEVLLLNRAIRAIRVRCKRLLRLNWVDLNYENCTHLRPVPAEWASSSDPKN